MSTNSHDPKCESELRTGKPRDPMPATSMRISQLRAEEPEAVGR
jgi:hypothetical protein